MEQHADGGVLKDTAIAIGGAAGKIAALAKSVVPHATAPPEKAAAPAAKKKGRLPAKHKARMPRKEKKMMASHKTA